MKRTKAIDPQKEKAQQNYRHAVELKQIIPLTECQDCSSDRYEAISIRLENKDLILPESA